MTDQAQLLSLLADISEPSYPDTPLLAPGHWLLIAFAALCLGMLSYRLWRRWQQQAAKRQAWREFQRLDPHDQLLATQLNQLLKRLLKSYWPNHPLLSAGTADWQQHWQQCLPPDVRLPDLSVLLYQAPSQHTLADRQQLYQAARLYLQAFNANKLSPPTAKGGQDV
jgi:hypothetical protein